MLSTAEEHNTPKKKSTHLTRLKAGGRFAIYAFSTYLTATFTIGCLGLIIGSPLLTFPLAMLIFHPVIWVVMGIVLMATYKIAVEPIFHLAKDFVNKKTTQQESEEKDIGLKKLNEGKNKLTRSTSIDSLVAPDNIIKNEKLTRSLSLDSGLDVISRSSSEQTLVSRTSLDSGVSLDSECKQTKKTKVKTYSTAGDGNCFFHAVFGSNNSGTYRAEKAQEMRMEWHKFLSQFNSLNDSKMPAPLKAQLGKIFNIFLNKPEDLTSRSDNRIKKLAEQTNEEIRNAKDKVRELVDKIIRNFNVSRDKATSDLREYAEALDPGNFDEEIYKAKYNSDVIANSFFNNPELYKAYLEEIKSQRYFIFIEEIPILASLANIEIDVHYKRNNNDVHTVFKPNPEMINEGYQKNSDLWGDKEQETIYLKPGHYERAEIVELTPPLSRFESITPLASSFCPIM